jgi:hypothetical protein
MHGSIITTEERAKEIRLNLVFASVGRQDSPASETSRHLKKSIVAFNTSIGLKVPGQTRHRPDLHIDGPLQLSSQAFDEPSVGFGSGASQTMIHMGQLKNIPPLLFQLL